MPSASRSLLTDAHQGAGDLIEGVRNWRVSYLMGISDIRRRYARSRLGQFWLTISAAITVVTLGLVWSLLWKMPVAEMLPFFSIGYVMWIFIVGFFNDATSAFAGNANYYMNQRMSFSTAIYALAYRNLVTLSHNMVIVVCVILFFAVPLGLSALAAIIGLLLVTVTGIAAAYPIAILCARYRDITQIVTNGTQIAFFITPILWKEQLIPVERRWVVDYNPFAVLIAIVRDPLLGINVPAQRWLSALMIAGVATLISILMIGRYRRRIIFWL